MEQTTTTFDELSEVCSRAKRKLERIIEREGNLNGERLELYYLKALIDEELQVMGFKKLINKMNAQNAAKRQELVNG